MWMGEEVFFEKKFLGNEKFNENYISFQKDIFLCQIICFPKVILLAWMSSDIFSKKNSDFSVQKDT